MPHDTDIAIPDDSDPKDTFQHNNRFPASPIDSEAKPTADFFPSVLGAAPNPSEPLSAGGGFVTAQTVNEKDESDTQHIQSIEDSKVEKPSTGKALTASSEPRQDGKASGHWHYGHRRASVSAATNDRGLRQYPRSKDDEIYELKKSHREQLERLEQRIQRRDETIGKLKQDLLAKEKEVVLLQQNLLACTQEKAKLQDRYHHAEAEIRRYTTQAAHDQELLESRRKELQGTRAFLSTSNVHSGEEIVSMVKALNAEIFQAAASMTDMIVESNIDRASARIIPDHHPKRESALAQAIGEEATKLLQCNLAADDYIVLVQTALQALLNQRTDYIFRLWTFPGSLNDGLARIFTVVQQKQCEYILIDFESSVYALCFIDQVVSRTWRAMTKAETKKDVYQNPETRHHIANSVKHLFFVAGWWTSENPELETQFYSDIEGRVSTILSHLQKLDEAIAGFTSMDLTLYLPLQGAKFVPATMDDADRKASSRTPSTGVVLFTSEIGLKDMDVDRGQDESILLKPKVVLREAFLKTK
ncbi:hypothetical protein FB446DRAFT_791637 [Lentinula raphanica]|nr:hypothetical protein FB446DRAFT_791637 [Lentinula raphanica]